MGQKSACASSARYPIWPLACNRFWFDAVCIHFRDQAIFLKPQVDFVKNYWFKLDLTVICVSNTGKYIFLTPPIHISDVLREKQQSKFKIPKVVEKF